MFTNNFGYDNKISLIETNKKKEKVSYVIDLMDVDLQTIDCQVEHHWLMQLYSKTLHNNNNNNNINNNNNN
jgi:hypothetical protein